MDWNFSDFDTVAPVQNTSPPPTPPPSTTPPETVSPGPLKFYSWFVIKHPGADMVPLINVYVDEYIQYLEEEKKKTQKLHATIKIQALQRGKRARENIQLLRKANLLKRLTRQEEEDVPSLLTRQEEEDVPSLLTRQETHAHQSPGEDSWIGSMKNMILSGIFNYTIDQLRNTHRMSIILENHDLEDNLGFNVDSLDMSLEGRVPGSIYVQWHAKEQVGMNEFGETTMDFPNTRSNLLKDDFIRGYTYIAGRNTITSNSSEDIIGVITRAGETPQINIIICKSGRKTSAETLKKWSKDNIPVQLANIIQNKFRRTISEVTKGNVRQRNSHGIFDHAMLVNTLTNILNDSTGVLQPTARQDPVHLPSNIVMEKPYGLTYFSYQPPPQQQQPPPPINRKALVPADLKPMNVPIEVEQIQHPIKKDITVSCNENLYYSMFVNYWFNGLTPELNELSEQVDLRYMHYDTLKTLHPEGAYDIEIRYIHNDKGHDEAFEKLFHYDYKNRREMFNDFVGMITQRLRESNTEMEFAYKFALFDLSDLVPTILDKSVFGADFVSTMNFHSKPNDDQLKEARIPSGKLPDSDYKAVMASIYYSLSIDLISSGNIKLMFILLDKIKEMCQVQSLFKPLDVDYYRKVFLSPTTGYRVPIDAHRQYIQAFQEKMKFKNPTQIRHGTLASAFNEYVYNAEINRRKRIWVADGNPYRAKTDAGNGGPGKRLMRWFPRLGDMRPGLGMTQFPEHLESLESDDVLEEDLTPVYEYIDNRNLDRCIEIFLDPRPPWMNTIYQKKFYWFLLGVFCNDDIYDKQFRVKILMDYLNLNIASDKRFKNITELENWMGHTGDASIGFQLLRMGLSAWEGGRRKVGDVSNIKESLFRWYSEKKKINNIVNRL